jgi:hypothetical protein
MLGRVAFASLVCEFRICALAQREGELGADLLADRASEAPGHDEDQRRLHVGQSALPHIGTPMREKHSILVLHCFFDPF